MVRSMYSGVSGLMSHQTRMDTIGNNIANVNTYGFKSGRTTFRDIYYQTMTSASAPTAAGGGVNPSSVGYGAQVGSVDLMMSRSTFTMTSQTMDLAIDGEGFFQVQDAAGNTYYTRAGMLNFDAAGNLVDMQGNYVLGVNGDPTGRLPSSERISVTLPVVNPAASIVSQAVNGQEFTLSTTNATTDGNLNVSFTTDNSLPDDAVEASISSTGIIIKMHPDNSYTNFADLNTAINNAITTANNNTEHPAGTFSLSYTGTGTDPFAAGPLTASQITSTNYDIDLGTASFAPGNSFFGGMYPTDVSNGFTGTGAIGDFTATYAAAAPPATPYASWTTTLDVGGVTYEGVIDETRTSSGEFYMYNTTPGASPDDYIVMRRPSFNDIVDAWNAEKGNTPPTAPDPANPFNTITAAQHGATDATPSEASRNLGISGTTFALRGGTEGGPQTIADMTGISIAPNGIITGWDSVGTEITIGRIDLVTFANPAGLNQAGSSNYTVSANSGDPIVNQPGAGGAGQLVGGSLELSNVDLSREFSDMITTQRGYQANSRIITVSDTMLEELINLKR